jgi:predicted ester cyclase
VSETKTDDRRRDVARHALERVCSGRDPSAAGVYSERFRDHVNGRNYEGHDGIRDSLALYQLVFRDGDLQIRVEDQVAEGDKVASRWVATGHNRGRPITTWGVVISTIEDGEIIEDWAASDSLTIVRQLGIRRSLLLGFDYLRRR